MNIEYIKEKRKGEIADIISRYPADRKKSALLPLLHIAQEENGWLPVDAMDEVAEILDIKPIEVYEVAAEELIHYLEDKLGVAVGETTADGLFTIKPVECLAACGTGPVLQIGPEYHYHENLTREKLDQLIDELRRGG